MKKPKNVKICLNAMVGNEEATITRMLKSVVGYVDYYVIQCNGKIDNTKQIIDDFFAQNGVPGFTYEIEECHTCIRQGKIESTLWSHQNSLDLIGMADKVRKLIGLKFPLEN